MGAIIMTQTNQTYSDELPTTPLAHILHLESQKLQLWPWVVDPLHIAFSSDQQASKQFSFLV